MQKGKEGGQQRESRETRDSGASGALLTGLLDRTHQSFKN